jgi:hypothetical protein
MKAKRTLLPVEWTDVVIENVPIMTAARLEAMAAGRLLHFVERGNHHHATRSPAKAPRHMVQVFGEI